MQLALIMRIGDERDRVFPLHHGRTIIGRDGRCDLRIALPSVSARHCEITLENQRALLLSRSDDLETLVNGRAVKQAELADADEVQIGPVTFRVSLSNHPGDDTTRMTVHRSDDDAPDDPETRPRTSPPRT